MADYNFINSTGVIVPDFADTLAQVESEYRQIEGMADVDLSPETPQGAFMLREALTRDNIARNNALLANQINPNLATGVFFDAIFSFMGGARRDATFSIIRQVEMSGVPGTTIPAGSLASSGDNQFQLLNMVIIQSDGKAYGDFQALESGPIPASVGTLISIDTGVLGWEAVTNANAAEPGRSQESIYKARRRREQTLALQGSEAVEALVSALYDLPDVNSLSFLENYQDTTQVIKGITLVSHSMWFCIDGGDPVEMARALKRVRGIGPAYNGAQTATVTDAFTNQDYVIKFDRPTVKQLFLRVTVRASELNAQQIVPELVQTFLDGETPINAGLGVGLSLSPFEVASGINHLQPGLFVLKVEVSDDGATWSSDTYPIAVNELASVQPSATTVVVV